MRKINGIICIQKPQGETSFRVVSRLRGITGIKKAGHAGTLDPLATGVLPVFFGKATRAVDMLPVQDKEYVATFQLGVTTDTQDITGTILEKQPVLAGKQEVFSAAQDFRGEYMQVPPMYAAVKYAGERLYHLARRGITVEREARKTIIDEIEVFPLNQSNHIYILRVRCAKGTYIRTLCHDIGRRLSCGAVMLSLCRTASGGFTQSDCVSLDEMQCLKDQNQPFPFIPIDNVFASYPEVEVSERQAVRFLNGGMLSLERVETVHRGHVRVYAPDAGFLGIGFAGETDLRVIRLFYGGDGI